MGKNNVVLKIVVVLLVALVIGEGFIIYKQYSEQNKVSQEANQKLEENLTSQGQEIIKKSELPKDEEINGENLKITKKYNNPKEKELVYTYLKVGVVDKVNYNENTINDYQYNIPQININSKNIEVLNKKILEKYTNIIDEMNKNQAINMMCESLVYDYFENNGILSLILMGTEENGNVFYFEKYNVDITSGEEITNKEILRKLNKEDEELKNTIEKYIDKYEGYNKNNYETIDRENVNACKEETLKNYKDMSIESMPLYVNDDNHICIYMKLAIPVGGGITTEVVDLEDSKLEFNDQYIWEKIR